ncbi:MAG: peptide chain release factor 2 [Candidatus Rokuibacteriota bacterium]|nr:MAG: peptide chain release factor 2 [Candidatus Rokubacteria bacterium]
MLGDLKREVGELTRRVDELRGHLDLPAKEARLEKLDAEMASPAFWDDNRRAQELIRERADLARTVARVNELARQASDLGVLVELAQESGDDGSLDAEITEGAATLRRELDEYELKVMLSGSHDAKPCIVSIHPGAGGTESQDWAQMLMRMYLRWCERAGFKAEVVDLLPGEEAGIKSVTIEVSGEYAYGYLRGEIGVHRLIRISPFDASSRRQTSFASVAVVPEVDDVEVQIRDDEIRVDVFRSSGPGGQGVNTADSAVRITHLPSNIVISCQNERSQLRNRDTAMRILKARLFEIAEKKQKDELSQLAGAKKEIAFGSQIRTYTFHPEQRIKDHRTGVEIGNVEAVMDGDIDAFIKAYLLWAQGRPA